MSKSSLQRLVEQALEDQKELLEEDPKAWADRLATVFCEMDNKDNATKKYTLAEVLLRLDEKWKHIAADKPGEYGQDVWVYDEKPTKTMTINSWAPRCIVDDTHRVNGLFDIERVDDWENSCLSRKQAERMVE